MFSFVLFNQNQRLELPHLSQKPFANFTKHVPLPEPDDRETILKLREQKDAQDLQLIEIPRV
jgi:hypothetical protein